MSKVYITGAGPGRADLLTVRAARVLASANAVLYDRLVSDEVLSLVRPGAELIDVGKQEGMQEETQARILHLLDDCVRRHDIVVRLKGGDPMVFGRGAEEWLWLAERGIEVEVIPGVSSAISVPEMAGIPVTCRGIAAGFAVVTGHRPAGHCQQWKAYAQADTLVVLMGVAHREEIAACLIHYGRSGDTPAAFIERGTLQDQRVVETTLAEIAQGKVEVEAPAVLIVGEVVRLRQSLYQPPAVNAAVHFLSLLERREAHAG